MPQEVLEPVSCIETLEHPKIMEFFRDYNIQLNLQRTSLLLPLTLKWSVYISWSLVVLSPPGLWAGAHSVTGLQLPQRQLPKNPHAHCFKQQRGFLKMGRRGCFNI